MQIARKVYFLFFLLTIVFVISNCGGGGGGGSSTPASPTYSTSDLQATWYYSQLDAAPDPGWWGRGATTIDQNGTASGSYTASDGSQNPISSTISVSSEGLITINGDANFLGYMGTEKNIIIATTTDSSNSKGLELFIKKGTSYSTANLVGTWYYSQLDAAPDPGWWGRGTMTIDQNGNASGSYTASDGSQNPISATLAITSEGVLTINGEPNFLGYMGNGKTIIVATTIDSSNSKGMNIWLKKASSYSSDDLVGSWYYSQLDAAPDPGWWGRGSATIAQNGTASGNYTASDGSQNPISSTMSLSSEGLVTINGDANFLGYMDSSKKIIVTTTTDSSNSKGIEVFIKK